MTVCSVSETPAPPKSGPRLLKGVAATLIVLALIAFIGYLAIYTTYAAALFRWPYDYDQGEGFELYDAILYRQGEWPYRDNDIFPYYASNYPPLFHLLIVPLLPLFGERLVAGRVLSFVATLVTAAAIGLAVKRDAMESRLRRAWVTPALCGLAYLAANIIYQIGPLCRLHPTMVMFETLAVTTIAGFQHPRHGRRNLLLGLFFSSAPVTPNNSLSSPSLRPSASSSCGMSGRVCWPGAWDWRWWPGCCSSSLTAPLPANGCSTSFTPTSTSSITFRPWPCYASGSSCIRC
jgi:hypothetical protein